MNSSFEGVNFINNLEWNDMSTKLYLKIQNSVIRGRY